MSLHRSLCLARTTARPVLPFPICIYKHFTARVGVSPRVYTHVFPSARGGEGSSFLSNPKNEDFRPGQVERECIFQCFLFLSLLSLSSANAHDAQLPDARASDDERHDTRSLSTLGRYAAGSTPATPSVATPHPRSRPRRDAAPRNDATRARVSATRVVRASPIPEQDSGGFKAA